MGNFAGNNNAFCFVTLFCPKNSILNSRSKKNYSGKKVVFLNVTCPECEEKFDLDKNEYDEGDAVECPECGLNLKVRVKKGKFKLATSKADIHEFDEVDFDED